MTAGWLATFKLVNAAAGTNTVTVTFSGDVGRRGRVAVVLRGGHDDGDRDAAVRDREHVAGHHVRSPRTTSGNLIAAFLVNGSFINSATSPSDLPVHQHGGRLQRGRERRGRDRPVDRQRGHDGVDDNADWNAIVAAEVLVGGGASGQRRAAVRGGRGAERDDPDQQHQRRPQLRGGRRRPGRELRVVGDPAVRDRRTLTAREETPMSGYTMNNVELLYCLRGRGDHHDADSRRGQPDRHVPADRHPAELLLQARRELLVAAICGWAGSSSPRRRSPRSCGACRPPRRPPPRRRSPPPRRSRRPPPSHRRTAKTAGVGFLHGRRPDRADHHPGRVDGDRVRRDRRPRRKQSSAGWSFPASGVAPTFSTWEMDLSYFLWPYLTLGAATAGNTVHRALREAVRRTELTDRGG